MEWREYDTGNCSIQRTLEVVGEKWTFIVLREVFNGVRRFDQIREHVGVSDPVLADRLRKLVAAEILEAAPYREAGKRARLEYRLTAKGLALQPVMISLMQWGDEYCGEEEGASVLVEHKGCGEPVRLSVECAAGHRLDSPRDAQVAAGPGARRLAAGR